MDKIGPCPYAFHICSGNIIQKCGTLEGDRLNWNTDLGKFGLSLRLILTLEGNNPEKLHFLLPRRKIWQNSAWNTVNLQKGKGWCHGTCSQWKFYYNLSTPSECCNIVLRTSSLTPPSVCHFLLVAPWNRRAGCPQTLPALSLPCLLSQKHTHFVATNASVSVAQREARTRAKQNEAIQRIPGPDTGVWVLVDSDCPSHSLWKHGLFPLRQPKVFMTHCRHYRVTDSWQQHSTILTHPYVMPERNSGYMKPLSSQCQKGFEILGKLLFHLSRLSCQVSYACCFSSKPCKVFDIILQEPELQFPL